MTKEEFRVLMGIENGMKSHEIVPIDQIAKYAKLTQSLTTRLLRDLHKNKLVWRSSQPYIGFRLTYLGYDYLALRTMSQRESITGIAQQIGVGKEADIYLATNAKGDNLVLKFHRLGRTSFRAVKSKRDYNNGKKVPNWLYLSRLSAEKEYAFMKALYDKGLKVPKPVDSNRHCVLMERIDGTLLANVKEMNDSVNVFSQAIELAVTLAELGLIHCDLNEFNLILSGEEVLTLIDFPQMVSVKHKESVYFFNRDINCIKTFFWKRFGFGAEELPNLKDIKQKDSLDKEVKASGFDSKFEKMLHQARKEFINDDDSEGVDEEFESGEIEENEDDSEDINEEDEGDEEEEEEED
ncbi:Serine/threonine-protein kinase RIO2 [Entamoeba marina]